MTTASNTITITVGLASKQIAIPGPFALYESRAVNIVLDNGQTWPSGEYTLALTYDGRAQASAACSWSSGALTATISTGTLTLADLFDILGNPRHVTLDVTLRDEQSLTTWGRGRVDVLNTDYTDATASPQPTPPSDYYEGSTAISSGADTVTVNLSAYALTVAPRVICTVNGGALNIFATVTSKSATAFTATLSAQADSSSYVLNWVVFP